MVHRVQINIQPPGGAGYFTISINLRVFIVFIGGQVHVIWNR